jgi:hypothetical protein
MQALSPESQISLLLFLLVLLSIKHFLADYLWQTDYMLRKVHPTEWQLPLLLHSGVHGLLTALIMMPPLGPVGLVLGLVDFAIHFVVDYWKAQKVTTVVLSRPFWLAFGIDQMLHHLTYIAIAYMAVHFF